MIDTTKGGKDLKPPQNKTVITCFNYYSLQYLVL